MSYILYQTNALYICTFSIMPYDLHTSTAPWFAHPYLEDIAVTMKITVFWSHAFWQIVPTSVQYLPVFQTVRCHILKDNNFITEHYEPIFLICLKIFKRKSHHMEWSSICMSTLKASEWTDPFNIKFCIKFMPLEIMLIPQFKSVF
jgi:hypothetical protein